MLARCSSRRFSPRLSRPRASARPAQCLRWGTCDAASARASASSMRRLRPSLRRRAPATTSLHSSKQQGDIALNAHVASVCFKCFRGVLQVFQIDVAKIYQDVAYVAMAIHACCKGVFQMFHLFFRSMLKVCLFWVLLYGCCICFTMAFQVFFLCFCKCFRHMF